MEGRRRLEGGRQEAGSEEGGSREGRGREGMKEQIIGEDENVVLNPRDSVQSRS